MTPEIFLDGAVIVCAAGWIGARAYHIALRWDYYAARPDEIVQIGLGGLAMRGAFLAGFLALALYARARGLRFGKLADASALGLTIGQAIGWVGALAHGANYGVVSDSQIALELPDLYGLIAPRFPLQHFEIVLFLGLFVGLLVLALRQPRAGTLFLAYLPDRVGGEFRARFLAGRRDPLRRRAARRSSGGLDSRRARAGYAGLANYPPCGKCWDKSEWLIMLTIVELNRTPLKQRARGWNRRRR